MAEIKNLAILNPTDASRMYSVATGEGAPADDNVLASDIKNFPVGSQFTDTKNKKFYVRTDKQKKGADWTNIGA